MTVSIGIVLRITPVGTDFVTDRPTAHTGCGRPSAYGAGDTSSVGVGEAA